MKVISILLRITQILSILFVSIVSLSSFYLFLGAKFIKKSFGQIPISQIIFNTFTKTEGMLGALDGLWGYIILLSLCGILFLILLSYLCYLFIKNNLTKKSCLFSFIFICLFSVITFFSFNYVERNFKVIDYLKKESTNFIKDHYYKLDVTSASHNNDKKQNLILIFVESLESGYQNPDIYQENLIPNLSSLLKEGISFSNFKKTQGAFFTIDGVAAQTTGMPLLQLPPDFHMIDTDSYGAVLSHTPGIFNLLKADGYHTFSFIGTHGWFTNQNLFFKAHGIDDLYDRNRFIQEGIELDDNKLGFHDSFRDDFLIEQFKSYLSKLEHNDVPFAGLLETYDSHFPNGFAPKENRTHGENNIKDSWLYVDNNISQFISWAKDQVWYPNTTIVIVGDHPWMDGANDFSNFTKKDNTRQIFNVILNSQLMNPNNQNYTNMDMAPTILNAMGINFVSYSDDGQKSSSKLGLGVSLFSEDKTLVNTIGQGNLINDLSKYSYFYDTLQ